MQKVEDIAVVILNWNGMELLQKFLPSVINCSENAKIYLADNASDDDSVKFVESHFPTVKIIQNKTNYGFAKGYNHALKHVKEPILCLLNSDVEVTKDWLIPVLKEFNSDNQTAIIQPKILDYNDTSKFEYAGAAGGFIDKYSYPFCRGRIFNTIEKDTGQYDDIVDVFWASGACFFIRNETFQFLNGFDERYFAHMEEIDLCWRAFNHNLKTKYVGASSVYHVGGATLKDTSPKKTYLNFRNSLFTLVKNTDSYVVGRTITRMLLDGIAAFRFLLQLKPSHFVAVFRAHLSFYNNLSAILKLRKELPKRANYYKTKSIVWSYYMKGKHKFWHL